MARAPHDGRIAVTIDAADLVGAWRLASWSIEYGDGRLPDQPFGRDAEGLLLYSADGWMSAAMWKRERTRWSAASAPGASIESRATAATELLTYAGRWSLVGDVVVHDVVMSLNPALIGSQQRREVRIDGGRLALVAREADAARDQSRVHRIEWLRA
jgi:hypothetical protein